MSLTFTIGSSTAAFERSNYYDTGYDEHGDWPVEMDTAAVIVNGRTYAPVRYLAEAFDYGVDWDAESKTVQVFDYAYRYSYCTQMPDVVGICFTPGKNYSQLKSAQLLSVTVNGKDATFKVMDANELADLSAQFVPGAFYAFYVYGAFEAEQSYVIRWTVKETLTNGEILNSDYSDTWYVSSYGGY